MGLINCRECGKEISDTAKTCPSCGAPNKKTNKYTLAISIGVIILLMLGIFIMTRESKPSGMSADIYNLGIAALEIGDDYLDAKTTKDDASDKLDNIYNRLERIEGMDSLHIRSGVHNLKVSIFLSDSMFSDTTDIDIVDSRNNLADSLNKKKR